MVLLNILKAGVEPSADQQVESVLPKPNTPSSSTADSEVKNIMKERVESGIA